MAKPPANVALWTSVNSNIEFGLKGGLSLLHPSVYGFAKTKI